MSRSSLLEAQLWDHQLTTLLVEQVIKGVSLDLAVYKREISLLMRLLINYSLLKGQTVGMQMENIVLVSNQSKRTIYWLLSSFSGYVLDLLHIKYLRVYAFFKWLNFLVFLRQGKYRSILDRILGLKYRFKSTNPRLLDTEYMNQEIFFQAITEFVGFARQFVDMDQIRYFFAKKDTDGCFICLQQKRSGKIEMPKTLDCGHVFCYYCITSWQMSHTTCPKCQ
ncbi:hypothetical protein EDD86DRAFT_204310 [Gorgonomyces haynaldii]|nr:hypothetical protein EDD86DRAFT_204310 [Gorgonomyces haynaldii]